MRSISQHNNELVGKPFSVDTKLKTSQHMGREAPDINHVWHQYLSRFLHGPSDTFDQVKGMVMKTIIVATDYSDNAKNALQYAGSLAVEIGAKLILLNAFQLPLHASNTLLPADSIESMMQENMDYLKTLAREMSAQFKIKVEYASDYALVEDALKELVAKEKAELVVIGMHSNDWSDRFLGNTATAILRSATYPVLMVPEKACYNGIKRILYAFDSQCLYHNNQLALLKDLSNSMHAEVEIFHVGTPNSTNEVYNPNTAIHGNAQVEGALSGITHYYRDIEDEDVIRGIEKGVEECGAELIAMSPRKLNFWRHLISRSATRAMALRTYVPLLILPNVSAESYN